MQKESRDLRTISIQIQSFHNSGLVLRTQLTKLIATILKSALNIINKENGTSYHEHICSNWCNFDFKSHDKSHIQVMILLWRKIEDQTRRLHQQQDSTSSGLVQLVHTAQGTL